MNTVTEKADTHATETGSGALSTLDDPTQAASSDGVHDEVMVVNKRSRVNPWTWFEQGHWLGKRRTPLLVRLWRYGAGSVLAFVTSGVALFICIQWIGLGATTATVIAFVSGALPNWILNRRWAWEKRQRDGIGTETTLYVVVSLVSLGISVAVDKGTAIGAAHLHTQPLVRHLLVEGMYLLTTIVLAGAKYVAYDRWVFVERRATSRAQVRKTTEVKRAP